MSENCDLRFLYFLFYRIQELVRKSHCTAEIEIRRRQQRQIILAIHFKQHKIVMNFPGIIYHHMIDVATIVMRANDQI